ncbi:polysaccharide biosynthesis protein [Candidatus Pelagibacter sp.]|nr:polysaccharide biosynthesis protein [Candidatus Pelagibacter sp.]
MKNNNFYKNKIILITGATGSIGKSLVLKLLRTNCKTVRALSNDEDGLFKLKTSIEKNKINLNKIRFLYGDIREYDRCLMATKNVDIVIHAAALKHVEICNYNPNEAIKTNIYGTQNMVNSSIENKVSNFLHISTDKAAMATTTMGQTKSLAEKLIINSGINTGFVSIKFSAVRFGNILASRGSVIEKFIYQIKNNMPLTVTDKNMARYFMTIDVATKMILESISNAKGSEVFILKNIGKFKILDLATALAKYFKHNPKIKFTNKQNGEKINEKFASTDEINFLKETKNMYILDFGNNYKNKNVKKIELNERTLNQSEIISFLKKEHIIA